MRLVINLVCDTTVVQEPLDAVHITTIAVVADKLHKLVVVGSLKNQRARFLLLRGCGRVVWNAGKIFTRNISDRFTSRLPSRPTVARRSVGRMDAVSEARYSDGLRVELGVAQKPHSIVSTVRTVGDSVWRSVRGFREARLRKNCRTSTVGDRLGRMLASRERAQFASPELFQRNLAFSEFLVDEAKFIVLHQNLHVDLVVDSLLERILLGRGSGCVIHNHVTLCLLR